MPTTSAKMETLLETEIIVDVLVTIIGKVQYVIKKRFVQQTLLVKIQEQLQEILLMDALATVHLL